LPFSPSLFKFLIDFFSLKDTYFEFPMSLLIYFKYLYVSQIFRFSICIDMSSIIPIQSYLYLVNVS
jgi:hypothetical protein